MNSLLIKHFVITMSLTSDSLDGINESLESISSALNKTDWLSIINLILIPVSIAVTALITNYQNSKNNDQQIQQELKFMNYPKFSNQLKESYKEFHDGSLENTAALYKWFNLVNENLTHLIQDNSDISLLNSDEFDDEYTKTVSELAKVIHIYIDKTRTLSNDLSDIKSHYAPENSSFLVLTKLINQLNENRQNARLYEFRLKAMNFTKTSNSEIDKMYQNILNLFDPFSGDLQESWSEIKEITKIKIK